MEGKSFIKYIVIIIVILLAVFLSQQAYSGRVGKTLISDATNQAGAYFAKGSDWVVSKIYPKISGEVHRVWNTSKNQFSGATSGIIQGAKRELMQWSSSRAMSNEEKCLE